MLKNGHFLRGPSELYRVNAHFLHTNIRWGNTLFLPPVFVENICFDGFSLTECLQNEECLIRRAPA